MVLIVCSFRYSHPDQMILFTDPISGNRISFPPCLVTPATSNQEFAKGSIMDRRLLSQRAPVTACFEGLLLDSLLLFDDRSATVDDLYSSLKLNPFINTSEDVSLSSVWHISSIDCRLLRMFCGTICLHRLIPVSL